MICNLHFVELMLMPHNLPRQTLSRCPGSSNAAVLTETSPPRPVSQPEAEAEVTVATGAEAVPVSEAPSPAIGAE